MKPVLRITAVVAIVIAIGITALKQPVFFTKSYDVATRSEPRALYRHVAFLTSISRCADTPAEVERAAAYIEAAFRKTNARVTSQEFDARRKHYRNVIASFGPQATHDNPLFVVGAHYDAFWNACALPGADDNASGTAGLLELARLLHAHPPKRPVMLVAYANEEPPFFGSTQMGSAVHAESLNGVPTAGMICLEMIGHYNAPQTWPNWLFALLYPSHGDFIAIGGGWRDRTLVRDVKRGMRGAGGIRVESFTGPRETLDASDQRNYWSIDVPAVLITDTAFLRNPNYHTRRDTAETLDYAKMARVVDGVFNAVR